MRARATERAFAIASAGLAVLAVVAAAGVAGGTVDPRVHPEVPGEYDFTVPDEPGVARVDGDRYTTLSSALAAAEPGDTVHLRGRFQTTAVNVTTPNVTLAGRGPATTVIDGNREGDVLTIWAQNVTVRDLWVRNGGFDAATNDAGVWVDADGATLRNLRITEMTFGVWLDGVSNVRVVNNTIVGRERIHPLSNRGNGIQIWKTTDSLVANNRITDVRDGIYYSWATNVVGRSNTMWDLRYGVHYMYSDHCRLIGNVAANNDVGYALMVSQHLELVNNVAINNTGTSGHGILLKSIDHTTLWGNALVANENGIYVFNSLDNRIVHNLVLDNEVGVHLTAGSVDERVVRNSFIDNDRAVHAVIGRRVYWNTTVGNYWSGATVVDLNGDGVSEMRYRPVGIVERVTATHPATRVFAESPAFAAVRRAERTVPVFDTPGVVDAHPLVAPPHDNWRHYYERD